MKIGIYKDTLANGRGADIAVRNLAAGLAERGHDVTLFEKDALAVQSRNGHDVLVSAGTNEIRDLAGMEGLPPIVQQFHTDPAYPFRHWLRRWRRNREIKRALAKAAAIQVLRDAHVETVRRLLGAGAPPVSVIGNWSAFEGRAEPRPEKPVILCPGAFNRDKNQALLVEAFRRVAADFPEWEVHLYGRGRPGFRPHPRVRVMDYADLAVPYAECAFVAFPSRTEGFGLVIADAAAFGKPSLLIRDWIGCGEVVGDSVRAYAAGLRALMSDSARRHALGAACRAHCAARYARARVLDQWETLLGTVSGSAAEPFRRQGGALE